jgi:solute carrier family 24 (sodium/potassium/calcium exchanger), member 6
MTGTRIPSRAPSTVGSGGSSVAVGVVQATSAVSAPRRGLRRHRLQFQYQAAYVLTASFVVALATASVVSSLAQEHRSDLQTSSSTTVPSYWSSFQDSEQEHTRQLDANGDDFIDYSSYSCIHLFDVVPNSAADQCRFAKSCNQGDGVFLAWVFCSSHISYKVWCCILSPLLLIWTIVLFRMLGSTAEDYSTPPLEMFSVKLGLPPRFAGVSLLALGNGAADVSATRNAMTGDVQNGYLMSLGAVTGAAMFSGTVVAGMIVIVSDGIPCRGALVRDVSALMITALVALFTLHTGVVGPASISLFTTMYLVFVAIVLVADVYHRAVVLPRLERTKIEQELHRQENAAQQAHQTAGDVLNDMADEQQTTIPRSAIAPTALPPKTPNILSKVMTALSSHDNNATGTTGQHQEWGIDSDNIINDRPIILHGANGILAGDPQGHPEGQEPSIGNYAIFEDGIDHICVQPGGSAHNWRGAWKDVTYELKIELYDKWRELIDEDVPIWKNGLLLCEFPFTILRSLTVPIPCEGYYTRAMVAASLSLSPLWFAFYMWCEHSVNAFWNPPLFYVHFVVCLAMGALVLRHAPGGDGVMNLMVATPIALYGFVMAVTWIDWIADHLVALLAFLGIVCRIPGPILGLTILAWGNSMADLSANMTMTRKGLGNMAMVGLMIFLATMLCLMCDLFLFLSCYRRHASLNQSSTF